MLFSKNHSDSDQKFSFKSQVIKRAHDCRHLGIQIDSNRTFENHVNSILIKMASAIRSLFLVRNKIPLKGRNDVSCTLSSFFSVEYLFNLLQPKT